MSAEPSPNLPSVARARPGARWWNAAAAGAGASVLALSFVLSPDPAGVGTHQKLGLPPCTVLTLTGIPCPFCGMTTAFAHMAHGQPLAAVGAQPMGALLFLATVAGVVVFAARALQPGARSPLALLDTVPRWVVPAVAGAFAAAWAYKIWATVA